MSVTPLDSQPFWVSVLFLGLIGLCFVVLTLALVQKALQARLFRADARNPYRRYCRQCGQCQTQEAPAWDPGRGWWVEQGDILRPDCSCHRRTAS